MIKSMTGFAAVTCEDERATIALTLRAVNHRYLDLQLRLPAMLAQAEAELRTLISGRLARGRIELTMSLQLRAAPEVDVELNEPFGRALAEALDRARTGGLVAGPLTPGDLLRLPQALMIRERPLEADGALRSALSAQTRVAVEQALQELDVMRSREGSHLAGDLDYRRKVFGDLVEQVAVAAEQGRESLVAKLGERVRELRIGIQVDEATIAQEIVRMAGRSDISEEIARLRGHLTHWTALVAGPEPCGRKLDFLLQEMNREMNTIGSKADGLAVSELVIAGKAELEKMREQVQNVE